jgi:hypothetical protein
VFLIATETYLETHLLLKTHVLATFLCWRFPWLAIYFFEDGMPFFKADPFGGVAREPHGPL